MTVELPKRIAAIAVIAIAVGGAGVATSGCGAGESTASGAAPPAAASAPQAVDRLERNPRAVDPEAGVPAESLAPDDGATPLPPPDGRAPVALPEPVSDAEIRRELARSGINAGATAMRTRDGLAVAPLGAPPVVQAVIQAGNQIARLPYRYGGGHQTWIDTAYDCSASISFAFAAAGLLSAPMVSGQLAEWGEPGPGRWITIYANAEHAFMYVAGLRFDTSGLRQTGSRWQTAPRSLAGFTVRHPPGL